MTEPEKPRSRWRKLRLSLRVLMVIVLIIGGGLGWVVHRANARRRAVEAIGSAGGRVFYDWQYPDGKPVPPNVKSRWPRRLVDTLGPDYFADHRLRTGRAGEFPQVEDSLSRRDRDFRRGVAPVAALKDLEILSFSKTKITDEGLDRLVGLAKLRMILLLETQVTPAGIARLKARFPKINNQGPGRTRNLLDPMGRPL